MKTFLVEVTIQAGEYQKNAIKLIQAATQAEAESYALTSECHGELGKNAEWANDGIADLNWEFHYQIGGCKEVKPEDVAALSSYLTLTHASGSNDDPTNEPESSVEVQVDSRVTGIANQYLVYRVPAALWKKIVEEAGSQEDAVTYLQENISPTSHEVDLIDVTMEHDSSFEVEALPV